MGTPHSPFQGRRDREVGFPSKKKQKNFKKLEKNNRKVSARKREKIVNKRQKPQSLNRSLAARSSRNVAKVSGSDLTSKNWFRTFKDVLRNYLNDERYG